MCIRDRHTRQQLPGAQLASTTHPDCILGLARMVKLDEAEPIQQAQIHNALRCMSASAASYAENTHAHTTEEILDVLAPHIRGETPQVETRRRCCHCRLVWSTEMIATTVFFVPYHVILPAPAGGWRGVGRSDAQDGAQHAHQVRRHLEAPESHEGARPPKAQRSCVGLRPCAGATCPRICKQIPVWQEMRTAQAETSGVRDRRIATETRVAYAPPSRVHPGLAARHSTPTPTAGGGMRGCVLRTVYISAVVRRPEQTQHI